MTDTGVGVAYGIRRRRIGRLVRVAAACVGIAALTGPGAAGSARLISRAQVSRTSPKHAYCAEKNVAFHDSKSFVGITDPYVQYGTPRFRNCSFGLMAAKHIGIFRGGLAWNSTTPDFSFDDTLVAALAKHHIRFFPGLLGTPAGMSTAPASGAAAGTYPPANDDRFARFAALCVKRYGPGGTFWRSNPGLPYLPVRAWQIWNEPNLVLNWEPMPDPVAYAHLLRASYRAIKRVDRKATVVAAGMPFLNRQLETDFLSRMFRGGARHAFDALAIHPYAGSVSLAVQKLQSARNVMRRFGVGNKPLWVTEVAWAGGGARAYIANQRGQARNLVGFFNRVHGDRRLRVQKIFWYGWQDKVYGPDPSYWGYHLGLLTTHLHSKLALGALAKVAARLNR